MTRHLLTLLDLTEKEISSLITQAIRFKKLRGTSKHPQPLVGKTLGMIFEKSSTRTRVSSEIAMRELGGYALNLNASEIQLGRGETYADTTRVLSRYVHGLMVRTFAQKTLEEIASYASVPVINGLTDSHHPVQVLADLMTIVQVKKDYRKLKITYVGDGNNLANSWVHAAVILGFELKLACPRPYLPAKEIQQLISQHQHIELSSDPKKAVSGADVVYTDTWFSMGQEVSAAKKKAFLPFQLNQKLLNLAEPDAMVLHCLPAHRGEEITDEVIDGPRSYVFDEAENRLHIQKAILVALMGK